MTGPGCGGVLVKFKRVLKKLNSFLIVKLVCPKIDNQGQIRFDNKTSGINHTDLWSQSLTFNKAIFNCYIYASLHGRKFITYS